MSKARINNMVNVKTWLLWDFIVSNECKPGKLLMWLQVLYRSVCSEVQTWGWYEYWR